MTRIVMVVMMVLTLSAMALAQTDTLVGVRKGSIELGVAGGVSIPTGDYADVASTSGTGGVIVGYYLSPRFSLGADWGGHWHGGTDAADSLLGSESSFRVYRVLTPYVKYQFKQAKFSPYVSGLTGLYLQELKYSVQTPVSTVSQTLTQGYWGVALGGGMQWISDDNMLIFTEARFHNAMRSDSGPIQFFDVRVGIAFLL